MLKLTNAFSISMLSDVIATSPTLKFEVVSLEQAKEMVSRGFESVIGHADIAATLTNMLGVEVPMNRVNTRFDQDGLLVAQYMGPRLPEGTKELPPGARIEFILVRSV